MIFLRITIILIFLCHTVFAQVRFSARLSPALELTHLKTHTKLPDASSSGGQLGAFAAGVAAEFPMGKKHFLYTGINLLATQVQANFNYGSDPHVSPVGDYHYTRALTYSQLNVSVKRIETISQKLKWYLQAGFTGNIKLKEKTKESYGSTSSTYDPSYSYFDEDKNEKIISAVDAGLYVATGLQWQYTSSYAFFAGLYYNKGLTNIEVGKYTNNFRMTADLLGLEFGMRFR